MKLYRALTYLLAANMEAAVLLLAAWYVGEWLNTKYPQEFSWYVVTFSVAMIAIVHSWYLLFKNLIKIDDAYKKNKKKY